MAKAKIKGKVLTKEEIKARRQVIERQKYLREKNEQGIEYDLEINDRFGWREREEIERAFKQVKDHYLDSPFAALPIAPSSSGLDSYSMFSGGYSSYSTYSTISGPIYVNSSSTAFSTITGVSTQAMDIDAYMAIKGTTAYRIIKNAQMKFMDEMAKALKTDSFVEIADERIKTDFWIGFSDGVNELKDIITGRRFADAIDGRVKAPYDQNSFVSLPDGFYGPHTIFMNKEIDDMVAETRKNYQITKAAGKETFLGILGYYLGLLYAYRKMRRVINRITEQEDETEKVFNIPNDHVRVTSPSGDVQEYTWREEDGQAYTWRGDPSDKYTWKKTRI